MKNDGVKLYPFSTQKHAHDIELYRNRLYNTMAAMESGEIPMDEKRYDRIEAMYYGELEDLYNAVCFSSRDGRISYLTGPQIALAKKIVLWASETRAHSCIERGRLDLLKYC